MITKIKTMIKNRPKKIKVYMYASNICIKKIKVYPGEDIFNNSYIINVWNKKFIFGSRHVKIVVKPTLLKKNYKNEVHVEIQYEGGVAV